jgi:hypothetical protein
MEDIDMAWLRLRTSVLLCVVVKVWLASVYLSSPCLAQATGGAAGSLSDTPTAPANPGIPASTEEIMLPDLRAELLQRERLDQQARNELIEFLKTTGFMQLPKPVTDTILIARMKEVSDKLASVDDDNLKFMKVVVEKHGWLSKTLVGTDGAKAAWLILQHSDKDREFQKQCLEVMKKLPQGEVDPKDIAYLTDRVLVGEGKEQVYGTQLRTNEKGELELAPLFEPATVDQRRQRMGLGPLKEYMEMVKKQLQG